MIHRINRVESLDYLRGVMAFFYTINIGIFLKFLGEVSYSIYLLHPLVAIPTVYILQKYGIGKFIAHFLVAIPLILMISYIVYKFIAKPIIELSKKVSIYLTRNIT